MMDKQKKWLVQLRVFLQNLAILFSILLSLGSFLNLYLRHFRPQAISRGYQYFTPYGIDTHQILTFVLGLISLLIAVNLVRRLRAAWIMSIIVQSMSFVMHLFFTGRLFSGLSLISLFIVIVLAITGKDFRRTAGRLQTRNAILLALIPIVLAIFNAILGVLILHHEYTGQNNFYLEFWRSSQFLFLMSPGTAGFESLRSLIYANSLILITWICLIMAFLMILKPLVYNPVSNRVKRGQAHDLVKNFGQNPMSYLVLDKDKRYFFGELTDGMLAYTVINGVLVACGDMIVAEKNAVIFLGEIMNFANKNSWKVLFLDITDELKTAYEQYGFSFAKIGEDACIRLENYSLTGKKTAKVRANINHARKLGLTVHEYEPLKHRQPEIEQQIRAISNQWMAKKGAELGFMLGGLALENPFERRYFYALDETGKMLGFIIFLPYQNGQAYMADVTRRADGAPNGTMEIIMHEAFIKMQNENVIWGNLGLCPLANVVSDETGTVMKQIFQFIYENMNGIYGFKGLYQAKKKFNPSDWQERFIAYSPAPFGFSHAYAIVKAQNPKGINKLIMEKLRINFGK